MLTIGFWIFFDIILPMATKQTKKQAPRRSRPRRIHPVTGENMFESDGVYFLKLVVYFVLATFWIKFSVPLQFGGVQLTALPAGILIGIIAVRYLEKHQADRKIWYAVLIVIGLISYFEAAGIII